MTTEEFKNFNLKNLLTDELKSKWYYTERAWGLRVNKHSVVFDNDFKFVLEFTPREVAEKDEDIVLNNDVVIDGIKEASKGTVIHWNKGDIMLDEFITVKMFINDKYDKTIGYYDDDEYGQNYNDILNDILVYIANRI